MGAALSGLAALPCREMLDESDELLQRNRQLIYAVGAALPLPAGPSRWHAAQAVLAALNTDPEVAGLLVRPGVAWRAPAPRPEAFAGLRLLPGAALTAVEPDLMRSVAAALVRSPPRAMLWLGRLQADEARRRDVLRFVTDPDRAELDPTQFRPREFEDLLALRGLLAYGLLGHVLGRRHLVNYGVDPHGKKRMAVPYTASNTPAARAEFRHPDVALAYTVLAYYYTGLSPAEVEEAFAALFRLGPSARRAVYAEWYAASAPGVAAPDRAKIDAIVKIDLSNGPQLALLVACYRLNTRTIDFWLNACVLPTETMQYPQSLRASAWHVAASARGAVAGFSGTKDTQLLLPLQVRQTGTGDVELEGTDGKMVALLLENAELRVLDPRTGALAPDGEAEPEIEGPAAAAVDAPSGAAATRGRGGKRRPSAVARSDPVSPADPDPAPDRAVLDALVAFTCAQMRDGGEWVGALIDAGGLMAGTANDTVAAHLLPRLPGAFQGVVYFDAEAGDWVVRDQRGLSWPKHSSPIPERNAFVYFDESHCRGADMQLRIDARAVLTLGPRMGKDKLMQAAGRMRRLGARQRLYLAALPDTAGAIRRANAGARGLQPAHVLQWALGNTARDVAGGLLDWAAQGGHFALTAGRPERCRVPETVGLEDMYGAPYREEPVPELWTRLRAELEGRWNDAGRGATGGHGSGLDAALPEPERARVAATGPEESETEGPDAQQLDAISARVARHGKGLAARQATLDEECERELELQVEAAPAPAPAAKGRPPAPETPWDVAALLQCKSPRDLPGAGVQALAEFVERRVAHAPQLRGLRWSGRVFVTRNFVETVAQEWQRTGAAGAEALDEYLRPVDAFAFFPQSQEVLLLSDYEADRVLALLWARKASEAPPPFMLANLCFAEEAECGVPDRALVSVMLFSGETQYGPAPLREALAGVLPTEGATAAARALVRLRGLDTMLPRSDLEEICTELAQPQPGSLAEAEEV